MERASRGSIFKAVVVILILAIVGTSAYLVFPFAAGVLALRNDVAGAFTDKPASIQVDRPTVVREVQSLNRLETATYNEETVVEAQKDGRIGFLTRERLVFVAHGQVTAGLDLSRLREDDVSIQGSKVTIKLPSAEILYSRLDNDQSRVYDRSLGLLTKGDKDLESQVRSTAEKELVNSALQDGILKQAQANGQENVRGLLLKLGFTDVEFTPSNAAQG